MKWLYLFLTRLFAQLSSWFRAMSQRSRLEAEMEAELANHLESLTADLARSGYSPAEAVRQARIALGSMVVHKHEMRGSLGLRLWDDLGADLRYAARRLRRSSVFTTIAVVSLALAIGANTAIFSLAKQLLHEQLAVPHPANLRVLAWSAKTGLMRGVWGDYNQLPGGHVGSSGFSYPAYEQLRKQNRLFESLFATKRAGANAIVQGNAQQVSVEMVSGNYYAALGVGPQLGRVILGSDDAGANSTAVAVLSDGFWLREFGRSPAVLGQSIQLNGTTFLVVGVNPLGFTGVSGFQQSPDLFVPLGMQPVISPHGSAGTLLTDTDTWWMNVMGRLRPGISDASAQSVLDAQFKAIVRATMPGQTSEEPPQLHLRDGSRGLFPSQDEFAKPMAVLLTLAGFVLLLACANIANLMLARGTQRQREISVRIALGAGRARLVRQMLVESLLLAFLGGVAGLAIGYIGGLQIPKLMQSPWERGWLQIHFDWKVFTFTASITLLTGVLFGVAPAWTAARCEANAGLKESATSVTRRRKGWGGKSLVGFQIALSTLLVVGAGLFLRTLAGLNSVDVGFRTDHLLLAEVSPSSQQYPPGKDIQLHQQLEREIAAIPGVESVAAAGYPFIAGEIGQTFFVPEGEADKKDGSQMQFVVEVGNDFFPTLQIPILAGRGFGPQDTATSTHVAVINSSLARLRFPGQNPLGKRFRVGMETAANKAGGWVQIIGVCADTHFSSLRDALPPQFFLPYVQWPGVGGMTYEIRTQVNAESILPALRRVVQRADRNLPFINVRTQEQQIESSTQQERIFAAMTSGFGLLALALASVGVYGIMAYSVAQRTNEIGIRLALGALPRQVLGMILGEAAWISIGGIAVGLLAALLLARLVRSMLYGLQPSDPVSLIAGAGLLIAVALAASWLPARRAASVQPMDALRHE
jgi:predicted permease